ncbi:MAG: GNAT family N-acetyltransferase, partial [Acidimicrobiia bacterium]|nr:GNAT family N-acetyltransferase [Acidimicrobiia bacterium]
YTFTGGAPPDLEQLEERYRAQVAGPATGDEVWHNWIVRLADSGTAVGFVQATVTRDAADVAWVIGAPHQNGGLAREAAAAMVLWLAGQGVSRFSARIHPRHIASQRVAAAIGLKPTGQIDEDGEVVWELSPVQSSG